MLSLAEIEGPFISNMCCITPRQESAIVGVNQLRTGYELPDEEAVLTQLVFGDKIKRLRQLSSIPRARSASTTAVCGAIVAKALLDHYHERGLRVGITAVSTTASAGLAYDFECRGMVEGWDLIDPLVLPNTIPSALATQIAIACNTKGYAFTYVDGVAGLINAVQFSSSSIMNGQVDAGLVICAEEIHYVQQQAYIIMNRKVPSFEGAAGILLSGNAEKSAQWKICLFGQSVQDDERVVLPDQWKDAESTEKSFNEEVFTLYSLDPLFAISGLLERSHSRAVLIIKVRQRGTWLIGFKRDVR
jgi:hypothetical protein